MLYRGEPARYGMNKFRQEVQQPSSLKTYPLPILTSGLAGLAGTGFALQDTHQWAPYVGWGSGALVISLLAKKLWNLSDTNNAKSIYATLAVGSVGGFFVGHLLGKLLQNRELNPYMLAAIAGTGALCGIGTQYRMAHAIKPKQESSRENMQHLHESVDPHIKNFIAEMEVDGWKGSDKIVEDDDMPQQAQKWRDKALQDLEPYLSNAQQNLLKKTYHRQQIEDILLNPKKAERYRSEFEPTSLRRWMMWASNYYKTLSEEQWLDFIKADLHTVDNTQDDNFKEVLRFVNNLKLSDVKYFNLILEYVSEHNFEPQVFLDKIRNFDAFKEAELKKGR